MNKLPEQAAVDRVRNPTGQYTLDDHPGVGEFSDKGRGDLKIKRNAPRYGDNPLADIDEFERLEKLDEFARPPHIDRLHQMLTAAGVTDQQIKGGVQLTQDGTRKVAAQLGIGPADVQLYLDVISQQLRDQDKRDTDMIAEMYRQGMRGAGKPKRPFELAEARYSYEPDSLGSVTVRDSETGRETFVQGASASRLLAKLKTNPHENADLILGSLFEAASLRDEDDEDDDFSAEINTHSGSYNFLWKLDGRHGTGTVFFSVRAGRPVFRLLGVRDAQGNDLTPHPAMKTALLQQAQAFIGHE